MSDTHALLRQLTREYCAALWKADKAGIQAEDPESQRILAAMRRHPEWCQLWESGADFAGDIVLDDGTSPYAAIAIEAAAEGMTADDGDPVARTTFRQLRREGLTVSEARAEIARCLAGVWWEIESGLVNQNRGADRLHEVLRRVQRGETAADVWRE